ncbi:trimeric intracellular cation channel family protein [Gracilibacillus caseinilyticus]|uniref:Trimeric intracellular cation channel family protein n=1 Tax=Gracilibacillus caseinilyticus TaxID=2932256 RepID=A0ABY4ETB1_9BACI|nr:trimeric intracellular cation channel family protein [Gracilibacillus caseinilyticus]UOQ47509.1 trimeric intracellular cation channel family protein [Gracilibacillus caseinilyticus]
MLLIETFVYIGTIAFAISGALIAIKNNLDIFGVILLGLTTALAGGVIRDIMIGNIPPTNLADPQYFLVSLLACLITILFFDKLNRFEHAIVFSDAIGLGVFTAVGANAAISLDYSEPFLIVAMGLVTGIGGGVLRDVFVREIPLVFRKEIYGIASIAGSISLILMYEFVTPSISLYICLIVTATIRMLAVKWKWNVPIVHKNSVVK